MATQPHTLTSAIIDKISKAIIAGNYIDVSAASAGVPKSTFYDWLKRARKAASKPVEERNDYDRSCLELSDAVEEAVSNSEVRLIAIVAGHAEKHWQAAMTLAERRWPERWGKRSREEAEDQEQTRSALRDFMDLVDSGSFEGDETVH